LWHYTGKAEYRRIADHAMRFVAAPRATDRRGYLVAGVLLVNNEITTAPLHITVVGRKDDPAAQGLFVAAIREPRTYKRVEWLDEREGPLPNADVEYPTLSSPAAFFCGDQTCSAPIFAVDDLIAKMARHGLKHSSTQGLKHSAVPHTSIRLRRRHALRLGRVLARNSLVGSCAA
jgi:uncharacterized protein